MMIKKHILNNIVQEIADDDHNIFLEELLTIYNSEKKLNLKLPTIIINSKSTKIASGLIKHLKFTQEHLLRLETFFKSINQPIN